MSFLAGSRGIELPLDDVTRVEVYSPRRDLDVENTIRSCCL